ncbi:MAG: hypothetical protein FGM27_04675 [Candidatus Omnitrophica bacterium]|nr:hypothetical protein [Candidatus Omnitrophota bacterium]
MQKNVTALTAAAAALLALTNVLTLSAYLGEREKNRELAGRSSALEKNLRDCLAPAQSFAESAGFAVGKLQAQSLESYEALNEQALKTSAELHKMAGEALVVLNEQAAKTGRDLEEATDELLSNLNREIERFREALQKKTENKA